MALEWQIMAMMMLISDVNIEESESRILRQRDNRHDKETPIDVICIPLTCHKDAVQILQWFHSDSIEQVKI